MDWDYDIYDYTGVTVRYIKLPKTLSGQMWKIGTPIKYKVLSMLSMDYVPFSCTIEEFAKTQGHLEYIIDARVFRSELAKELLT